MALSPGTRIGSCEIMAPLGAGEMGEVYRATDRKLDRGRRAAKSRRARETGGWGRSKR